jgi:hypothetical protein
MSNTSGALLHVIAIAVGPFAGAHTVIREQP